MAACLSSQVLSNLIGSVYDCALDPSGWDATLGRLRNAFEAQTAVLHLSDVRRGRFLIFKSIGIEPYWQEQHARHAPEFHVRMNQELASWPSLDEPLVMSRHLSRDYLEASPYMQHCLKPHGIVDGIQYFLMHTSTRLRGFACARHERQGIITQREIEVGALLLPHIRRAVMISDVLDVREIERARMAEALDALRCAVILTDERGTILHANRPAEDLLRSGGLVHGRGGVLHAKMPAAAEELRAALRLAAREEAGIGNTGLAIRLTELDVLPAFAHVLPLTGGELRTRLRPSAVAAVRGDGRAGERRTGGGHL